MANTIILQDFQLGKGPITALSGGPSDQSLTGKGGSDTGGAANQIIPPDVARPAANKLFFRDQALCGSFPSGLA